jgi:hypothetical protein
MKVYGENVKLVYWSKNVTKREEINVKIRVILLRNPHFCYFRKNEWIKTLER